MELDLRNKGIKYTDTKKIHELLLSILQSEREIDRVKEHCWGIGVDNNGFIQYIELISLGILNYSVSHPREIFRLAIQSVVPFIMIAHNHPSGNCKPSSKDIVVTEILKNAGKIVDIPLLDHIIITESDFFSFRKRKMITIED